MSSGASSYVSFCKAVQSEDEDYEQDQDKDEERTRINIISHSSEQFMKRTMAHNTCNAIGEVSCTETDFCLSDCLVPSKVPVKAGPSKTVSFSHAFMRASLQTIR